MRNPKVEWGVRRTGIGAPFWCNVNGKAGSLAEYKTIKKEIAGKVARELGALYPSYTYEAIKYRNYWK